MKNSSISSKAGLLFGKPFHLAMCMMTDEKTIRQFIILDYCNHHSLAQLLWITTIDSHVANHLSWGMLVSHQRAKSTRLCNPSSPRGVSHV